MAAAAANAAAAPEFAQLYGDPDKVASEALDVLVAASPNLLRLDAGDETIKVVVDSASFEAAAKKRKADGSGAPEKKNNKQLVAVLAGGGSGHEPMAAGYVGPGCLSGAVAGDVFASPSTDAVRAALRAFEGNDAGVLLLVNNYTGDRLCFGAAAEAARAGGQKVEVVFVSDDVALLQKEEGGGKEGEKSGAATAHDADDDEAEEASFALSRRRARGLAGCVLVFKVAGAAAAAGLPLEEVAAAARRAADALSTMGLATSACALPGLAPPAGRCRPGAVELGMGLHGEAGAEVVDGPVPASELARALWERIEPHAARRARALLRRTKGSPTEKKPRAVLLVNSLGGCAVLETSALAAAVLPLVRASNFDVCRLLVGPFCTSLDMRGASVSLLPVDDELLSFIDAAVQVPAWPSSGAGVCCGSADERIARLERADEAAAAAAAAATAAAPSSSLSSSSSSSSLPFDASVVARCLSAAADAVVAARARLDELDGRAGDGDCGATLAGAARDVGSAVAAGSLPFSKDGGSLAATASAIGALVARAGGTSGGVYDIFFSAAAASLRAAEEEEKVGKDLPSALAAALGAAAAAVSLHGGAVEGDRTLLDALLPAARAAVEEASSASKNKEGEESGKSRGLAVARAAAAAAEAGAEGTAAMAKAGAGRSAYVRSEALLGHADPGAVGVATWLRAVAGALE